MAAILNTIKATAAAALRSVDAVLAHFLPGGKLQGREYVCRNPTRDDQRPGSFSVNVETGRWADFATGDEGGDLVALVAYIGGTSNGEAAKRLADFLGLAEASESTPSASKRRPRELTWRALLPVPDNAPPPPATHPRHGAPSQRWEYRDAAGRLLAIQNRFDTQAGKTFSPLTYCQADDGTRAWRWQGPEAPRPLYGLDRLAARPDAPVIVAEGEKAADSAGRLAPGAVAVASMNGAKSGSKGDWSPLRDRTVTIWPDADAPGAAYAATVASLAREAGARSVCVLSPEALRAAGFELPEGADAADLEAAGMTPAQLEAVLEAAAPATKPAVAASSTPTERSAFVEDERGVWFHGRDAKGSPLPPEFVCSPLRVLARTRDECDENWGYLLRYSDPDGRIAECTIPAEALRGDGSEVRGELLRRGVRIAPSARARVLTYIQAAEVPTRARCVSVVGWAADGRAFVLPHRTLGNPAEPVVFQGIGDASNVYGMRGTLAQWQRDVAQLATGNSRLIFAVSSAFAGPLLEVANAEGGGAQLRGDSSSGKTTALRVAASVWGSPPMFVRPWRATDNGLEAVAAQHSDAFLPLDELAQVEARVAGECAYLLVSGVAKSRANRLGFARRAASWRVLFLSTGEVSLAEHVAAAGKRTRAGMEVRIVDIPADAGAGLGVFEALHGFDGGAQFAKHLEEQAKTCYGVAGPAFVEQVIAHRDALPRRLRDDREAFVAAHVPDGADGQVHRAAARLALIATAGELATAWGITGWETGAATWAVGRIFRDWLATRGGAGSAEVAAMLAQVRRFIELHGESRFTDWFRAKDDHAPKTMNRAGFRKLDATADQTTYYVTDEAFRSELAAGFDHRAVARAIANAGILHRDPKGHDMRVERLPGMGPKRCYVLRFDGDDE